MNRGRRLSVYVLVFTALLAVLAASPRAWATPEQAQRGQNMTVPTPTPVVGWSPTPQRTDRPPTDVPSPQPPAATASPAPGPAASVTPRPSPTPASPAAASTGSAAALRLAKEVGRREAWPGATIRYTLTLTNVGTASAHAVILEDPLPVGLAPGAIQGPAATWIGHTLQVRAPVLPPGGRLVVAFDAVVVQAVAPGGLLVNRAQATAAGGLSASAEVAVALPPAELPVVGGAPGTRGAPR